MPEKLLPLVSICCITYNHQSYVRRSIESLWKQDYSNIEILVIDDGSTDSTFKILEELKEKSSVSMEIFTHKNTGNIGKNLNFILKKCRGSLVMFLSLDDELIPNIVGKLVAELESLPNCALLFSCKHVFIDDNSQVIKETELFLPDADSKQLLEMERAGGSFWLAAGLYRKELIEAVNYFDEDLIGDDIVLRTKILLYLQLKPQFSFMIFKHSVFRYRMHDLNISKNNYRQFLILSQVTDRYFQGRPSDTLNQWLIEAIRYFIRNKKYKEGFILYFSYRNKQKLKVLNILLGYLKKKLLRICRNEN
jgi:alpha-1,3-rhamnosyltransferase